MDRWEEKKEKEEKEERERKRLAQTPAQPRLQVFPLRRFGSTGDRKINHPPLTFIFLFVEYNPPVLTDDGFRDRP